VSNELYQLKLTVLDGHDQRSDVVLFQLIVVNVSDVLKYVQLSPLEVRYVHVICQVLETLQITI